MPTQGPRTKPESEKSMSKQKNGSNQEHVEQNNQKLKQYADELNQLQAEIQKSDVLCIEHGKRTLELAIKAGGILSAAHDLVPHGDWEDWVTENVKGISFRTTQNYIKLYFAAKRRDELIQNRGSNTQHVSLLDEAKSLREAYRAVGIIKKKLGANKDGGGDEKEPTPQQVKKDNPELYKERLAKVRGDILRLVPGIIKDHKDAKWDVSQWTVDKDDKPRYRNQGTTKCLNDMAGFIASRDHKEITHYDETGHKAGVVLSELIKNIIRATCPATPEMVKPEDFVCELGEKTKPTVEVAEKLAA